MKKRTYLSLFIVGMFLIAVAITIVPKGVSAQTTSSATLSPASGYNLDDVVTLRVDNKYVNGITSLGRLRAFVCANVKADGTPLRSSDVVAGTDADAKLNYCQEVKAWQNSQTVTSGNLAAGLLTNQVYSKTFNAIRAINGDAGASKCVQVSAEVTEPCRVKVIFSSGAGLGSRGNNARSGYPIHIDYALRTPTVAIASTGTVRQGAPITLSATNWIKGRTLTADLCTTAALTTCSATGVSSNLTSSATGELLSTANTVTFGTTAPKGERWLRIRDVEGGVAWQWAAVRVQIFGVRSLTLGSQQVRLGEDVAVTLRDFEPNANVRVAERVNANGTDNNAVTRSVDANGQASTTFTPSSINVTHLTAVELDKSNAPIESTRVLTPITVQSRACSGSLSFTQTGNDNVFGALSANGSTRKATATLSRLDISDTRCTASGWRLTAVVSELRIPGTTSNEFRIPASAITFQVTCRGAANSAAGLTSPATPVTMSSTTPVELCRSDAAPTSLGTFTLLTSVSIDVPNSQSIGEYFATVQLALQ